MGRIFACSDLHGMYDLWTQIKEYLQPDDELYYLGDVADRGYCGIMILKEMMACPNIHYLKGNHDEFMIKYLQELFANMWDNYKSVVNTWWINGGDNTKIELDCDCTPEEQKEIYYYLSLAPLKVELDINDKHFVLTHAGFNPWETLYLPLADVYEHYTWDREHFLCDWKNEWMGQDYSNWIEVHGHTPVVLLEKTGETLKITKTATNPAEVLKYADGHKYNIDLGSFITGKTALLCLNDLSVKYFTCDISDD